MELSAGLSLEFVQQCSEIGLIQLPAWTSPLSQDEMQFLIVLGTAVACFLFVLLDIIYYGRCIVATQVTNTFLEI